MRPSQENASIKTASFYKVIFDSTEANNAIITPLKEDQVWSERGLDKTKPFIVINPGDTFLNIEDRKEIPETRFAERIITPLVKIFERAVKKFNVQEERQYLVTINEQSFNTTQELVRRHNANPDNFTTLYAQEQARLIYGPLVTENGINADGTGTPLPHEDIVRNLSKARNYNECIGAISANCHINSLVRMMRDLSIPEGTIKDGIENMRRIDAPNITATNPGISPSTVIFEGSNDKLAEISLGRRSPQLPSTHTNTDIVEIDDHRIKVYQKLPEEVYDLSRKMSEAKEQEKSDIVAGLPKIYEESFRNPKTKEIGRFAKVAAKVLAESRQDVVLEDMKLDGPRAKDPRTHSLHHFIMKPTPGNEISGRDPDLLHKLMTDMITRESSKDVLGFTRASEDQKGIAGSKLSAASESVLGSSK
jgi:hypothetical protein